MINNTCEDLVMLREIIQAFGRTQITPYQKQWDEVQALPHHLYKQLGQLGVMGCLVPKEYGGKECYLTQYITVIEELAKLDAAVALSLLAHNSLCIAHILNYSNKMQQCMWLPKLSSGEWIGAWAMTEPEAGSDLCNLQTVALPVDGRGCLNGCKHFITNGPISNLVIVTASTESRYSKESLSAFIVEKNTLGVHVGCQKMGMRAAETAELLFKDCYVPSDSLLGKIGEGWSQVMHVPEGGRIAMAALRLGIAKAAFAMAIQHAKKRCQFKQPIICFQGIAFQLAELATKIEAVQALIQHAVAEKLRSNIAFKLVPMAKLLSSELAIKATNVAIQTLGGYGYVKVLL